MFNEIVNQLVGNIAQLVYEINQTTEYAAWFNITGHVDRFDAAIAKSKEDYQTKLAETHMQPFTEKRLKEVRDNLQSILDNGIDLKQIGTEEVIIKTTPKYEKVRL